MSVRRASSATSACGIGRKPDWSAGTAASATAWAARAPRSVSRDAGIAVDGGCACSGGRPAQPASRQATASTAGISQRRMTGMWKTGYGGSRILAASAERVRLAGHRGAKSMHALSPFAHAMPGTARRIVVWLLGALLVALAGCTSLPKVDREAIASEAIPLSPQTMLGHIALQSTPAADQSGFRLMPLGTFSYDTRLQLAKRAQVSLDLQYYHFEN